MLERRKRIVLSEIEQQCAFALLAYQDAATALSAGDRERFWYSLQGVLSAAAHLSGLLWPAGGALLPGPDVRALLATPDDSPLAPRPALPALLHAWGARPAEGPPRNFDERSSRFTFYGESYEIPTLLAAIAELSHRARLEIDRLGAVM